MVYSRKLQELLNKWPGKATFGIYRFLPLFFLVGAGLEWVMINARVAPGRETFYDVYRRKESERRYAEANQKLESVSQESWHFDDILEFKGESENWATKMPAGVDFWPYFKFLTASLLSMFAGAQLVHSYYKPELIIPAIPPKRGELGELRDKVKREAKMAKEKAWQRTNLTEEG